MAAVRAAYEMLYETVYRPGQSYLFCCSEPTYCPTVIPTTGAPIARPTYNTSRLLAAWRAMIAVAPQCKGSASFEYDLVSVGREYLSMVPCVTAFDAVNASLPKDDLIRSTRALLAVSADIDLLLQTSAGYLLGSWLKGARSLAGGKAGGEGEGEMGEMDKEKEREKERERESLADFYEWNARSQISTWQPVADPSGKKGVPGLADYARKEWSGMIRTYYSVRVETWLNVTLAHQQQGGGAGESVELPPNKQRSVYAAEKRAEMNHADDGRSREAEMNHADDGRSREERPVLPLDEALARFAYTWQNTRWDEQDLPSVPVGDAVEMSQRLMRKYT